MTEPKHVVGLSGGKDSTALALWLVENEPREYEFICNTTGNELPAMVAHWKLLEHLLGQPLKQVTHSTDLLGLIEEQQMLPNFRARWCTRILKIEPTIRYMDSLPDGSTLYVGLRADEEMRRGIYGEDMLIRFPLREQAMDETMVWQYLDDRGITIPERTDCAWCYHQRIEEWQTLWRDHPAIYAEGAALEKKIGHTFRSPGRDTWPSDLESLAAEFARGRELRKSSRTTACRVCRL
jgi:3'-phosphoadenosine 5'-phosphosulfate sulfotransferase (PAPS reductase)/FAD synthetase